MDFNISSLDERKDSIYDSINLKIKKNQTHKPKQTAAWCFQTLAYLNEDEYFAHLKKIKLIENVVECLWSMTFSRREHSQWKQRMLILNWESSASFHSYFLNNWKLYRFLEQPCLLRIALKWLFSEKATWKHLQKKYNN